MKTLVKEIVRTFSPGSPGSPYKVQAVEISLTLALHDDDDGSTFKTLYLDRCPRCSCWSRLAGQPWGPIDPWDTRRSLWSLQHVVNKSQTCPKVYCLKETQKQTHRRPRLSFTPRNKVGVCTSYDVSRLSLHADKSSDQTEPE